MSTWWEARLGSLIAALGIVWAAHVSTNNFTNLNALFPLPAGPMEICAVGVLIWLHAKWRKSVHLR
jgi:hypothetical protein